MTIRALDNSGWGVPVNCYVCEPSNRRGLQVQFSHDDEADLVFAEFELSDDFSGAPGFLHGGVVLALLDEAVAWAAIAVAGKWAVTQHLTTTFQRPILVGHSYRIEARVVEEQPERLAAQAVVLGAGETKTRAQATAELVPIDSEYAARILRDDAVVLEEHRSYLRED